MSTRSRILLVSLGGLLLAALVSVWGVKGALHGVPTFYHEAVQRETALAEQSSDEFLQEAASIASDVRKPGRWEAIFTADQVNGWLTVDMTRNHPKLLPETLSDPRVAIRSGDITLACRYEGPEVQAVLTISCDVYLSAPNTIAVRIKGAHAGLMPLPLGKVLESITHTARELELPLEWRRSGGDPVALLSMAPLSGHMSAHRLVELDTIELRDGELYVAGHTEHTPSTTAAASSAPAITAANQPAGETAAARVADVRARVPGADEVRSEPAEETGRAATSEPAVADQPTVAAPAENEIRQR